jgi:hypothetical protein
MAKPFLKIGFCLRIQNTTRVEGKPIFLDASHAFGGPEWDSSCLKWDAHHIEVRSPYLRGIVTEANQFDPWLRRIESVPDQRHSRRCSSRVGSSVRLRVGNMSISAQDSNRLCTKVSRLGQLAKASVGIAVECAEHLSQKRVVIPILSGMKGAVSLSANRMPRFDTWD